MSKLQVSEALHNAIFPLCTRRQSWYYLRAIEEREANFTDKPYSICLTSCEAWRYLASYPGHVVRGKSGLVSTVCACANCGNFPRTSPNTDKLHMVVMRRNNQTRYTLAVWQLCLRGDCFSLFVVSIILLRLASYPGHVPSCQILLGSQQLLVCQSVTDYSSTTPRP